MKFSGYVSEMVRGPFILGYPIDLNRDAPSGDVILSAREIHFPLSGSHLWQSVVVFDTLSRLWLSLHTTGFPYMQSIILISYCKINLDQCLFNANQCVYMDENSARNFYERRRKFPQKKNHRLPTLKGNHHTTDNVTIENTKRYIKHM